MPEGHRPGLFARIIQPWIMQFLRERLSEEQLRSLVASNTHLDGDERRIIDDVLDSGNSMIREIMVPRMDVVFLDARMELTQAVAVASARTHSRFPVTRDDQDDVIGYVHLRDLLLPPAGTARVADLARDVKRLPGTKRVLPALSEMRREGAHLAVVIDEYGGTAGIVTLEDLIEELVDEIPSAGEGERPGEADGRWNLADFAERTGCELPDGPYETLGGFVMASLGRLPEVGDAVEVAERGVILRVMALDGRRVARVGLAFGAEPAALPHQTNPVEVPVLGLEQ